MADDLLPAMIDEKAREIRWRQASRYALGKLTPEEALSMMYELQYVSQLFVVTSIGADDIKESLEDAGYDHPELGRWCQLAAQRAAKKWESDEYSQVRDFAEDLVMEYAQAEGVELKWGDKHEDV